MKQDVALSFLFAFLALGCACFANEMLWWRRFNLDTLPSDEMTVNILKVLSSSSKYKKKKETHFFTACHFFAFRSHP